MPDQSTDRPTTDVASKTSSALASEKGKTAIADTVVSKIAGMATREVSGVYNLGGGSARAVGAIRERIPGSRTNFSQGVTVEVGERQTAIDVDLVAEFGVALADLAAGVRRNVIGSVERMTGLEVTEVNITVHDVAPRERGRRRRAVHEPRRVSRARLRQRLPAPSPRRSSAAVLSVPDVHDLHGGAFGEVATYLPGRRVPGVRLTDDGVELHVVTRGANPLAGHRRAGARRGPPARERPHRRDRRGHRGMTPEERTARRAVIKAHHPDRGGDPALFVELLDRDRPLLRRSRDRARTSGRRGTAGADGDRPSARLRQRCRARCPAPALRHLLTHRARVDRAPRRSVMNRSSLGLSPGCCSPSPPSPAVCSACCSRRARCRRLRHRRPRRRRLRPRRAGPRTPAWLSRPSAARWSWRPAPSPASPSRPRSRSATSYDARRVSSASSAGACRA